jgi:hypothetical protein
MIGSTEEAGHLADRNDGSLLFRPVLSVLSSTTLLNTMNTYAVEYVCGRVC